MHVPFQSMPMLRRVLYSAALFLPATLPTLAAQTLTITPTTTLAAETGNNTSASSTFAAQSNGNAVAGNVSKLPTPKLLYSGSNTKLYAHLQGWFGGSNHINVGYSSNDAGQVQKQVNDMISRGLDGAILDWYGPNSTTVNTTAQLLRQQAEATAGKFEFAIQEDAGALESCAATSGCNVTQQLISDLTYAYKNFEGSAAYARSNGRPLVFLYGMDAFTINWDTVHSSVPGTPLFIFKDENSSNIGFAHAQSDGAFAWMNSSSTSFAYLDQFYSTALTYPAAQVFGSAYKGFDDSLAPWSPSPARQVPQQCGQTWLSSLAETGKYYSSSAQLQALQILTWNDYEEGTEIETGIDNCVSIAASISSKTLSWTITGSESTLDHYTVFISNDGQDLMALKDVAAGTHSLDLGQFSFSPGTYTFYVKAVGKPSIRNQMSSAVTWNPSDQPPVVSLTVSPTSGNAPLTVTASTTGSSDPDGTITSSKIDFGDGTTASGNSVQHTYSSPGQFVVTATVTDNANLGSSTSTTVTVNNGQALQAAISVSPQSGMAPLTVAASTANSTDTQGTITSSKIDFGDGTVASGTTAQHTYSVAGDFTVTGTVTDSIGAKSSATTTVLVTAAAGVYIKSPANNASVTSPVHFVASATATIPITSMKIYVDSQDSYTTFSNQLDTSLVIANGTHNITIQAWDGAGNVYKSPVTINVTGQLTNQKPVVALSVTPTSGPLPLTVTASTAGSSDPDGTITSTTLNFGDGTVIMGPTAAHTYNTTGVYTVTATVFDNTNQSSTKSVTVTAGSVGPGVTISSPVNNATVTSPVNVVAYAIANSGKTITSMKIYRDGTSVYSVSASSLNTNITAANGTHRLTVKAWQSGSSTPFSSTIYFTVGASSGTHKPPVASLSVTPTSGTAPLSVSASTVGSSDPDGSIAFTSINFGDGTVVSGASAQHTYSSAGTYTVTATVTDNGGLSSTATATVTASASSTPPPPPPPSPNSQYYVTISSPASNATVASPVAVVATATDTLARVTSMAVYLDSVKVYSVSAAALSTNLTVSAGTHRLSVNAWDSAGRVFKAIEYFTVP